MEVRRAHLFLGKVCNVTGHGRSNDEAASFSLSEVETSGSGAVVYTVQVGRDDLVPLLHRGVKDAAVRSSASIGNEDINFAEVLDDVFDKLLHLFVVANIALVCLGLDAVLFRELFGILFTSLRAGGVCDGDIGTKLSTSSGSFGADTGRARGAGDDDDLALEAEQVVEGCRAGDWDGHVGEFARISRNAGYTEVKLEMCAAQIGRTAEIEKRLDRL
jgi:hypothetical protein